MLEVAFGVRSLMQTGTCRPFFTRQIVSTEYLIYEWEYGREVLAIVARVFAMVPVVVLRGGYDVLEETEIDARIGMDEHGVYSHENDIGIEGDGGKPKHIKRDKGHRPGNEYIYKMGTGTSQPVHIDRGMMHRMETPEIRMAMKEPVRPILEQVGNEERKQQLDCEWQTLHPMVQTIEPHTAKEQLGRYLCYHPEELDEQMAYHKIDQVGTPFRVEFGWLGIFWEDHFYRHKDGCHK